MTGDYFAVNVIEGETYRFNSSIPWDFFTLSTDNNTTATAYGTVPLTWVATTTGEVWVNINSDAFCGLDDDTRTTSVVCGVPCLNGELYPEATYTPACIGAPETIAIDFYAGRYSNVDLLSVNQYTFGSSNPTDIITVASDDGLTALSTGVTPLAFVPEVNGVYRVYIHSDIACGTEDTERELTVSCALLTIPGCPVLVAPMQGSTIPISAVSLFWLPSANGGVVYLYSVHVSFSPDNLSLLDQTYNTSIPFQVDSTMYGLTLYWNVMAQNSAGESIDCSYGSFTFESDPLSVNVLAQGNFKAYPNPVQNVLNLSFNKNISNITVLNLLGEEVMKKVIAANQSQIDLSELSVGTYIVKIASMNEVRTIKVLKE